MQCWFQKSGSFAQVCVCKLTVCVDVKAEVSSPGGAAVVNVYQSLRSIWWMETERDKEPALPVQSRKSWSRDRALMEGTWGAALRHRWPLQGRGGWEALRLEAIIITAIIQSNHTSTPFGEITQASQNAPMKSLAIKEARTFPPKHMDIQAIHQRESFLRWRRGLKAALLRMLCRGRPVSLETTSLLGDMRGGRRVSPETPAPFCVLLTQDFLLALTLLLRAQVAIFFLQEPHRRPAMLLKVPLVFCNRIRKGLYHIRSSSFVCFKTCCFTFKGLRLNFFPFI